MKRAILPRMDEHWMYTVEEYVRLEDAVDLKHEFFKGDIRAMGGGSPEHARIGAAILGVLYRQLGGGRCAAFSCDLRIRIGDVITYPDASVVCGDVRMDPEDPNAALNPTVIIEVTSRSSENYDRGGKFAHYQRIASLREYVVVSHSERAIDVFRRAANGEWQQPVPSSSGEVAFLTSINCTFDVDELYRDPRAASS